MAEHLSENDIDREDRDDLRRELQRERRRERIEQQRVSRVVGFADFMAVLMVIATGFSAYAAWRTAQVTSLVFATADRPFLGVARIEFEGKESADPYLAVDYRNFGRIPAVDGLITVNARIDGKLAPDPVPGPMNAAETGSIPPNVDNFFYRYLPGDAYKDVVNGKSRLQVEVRMVYKGPAPAAEF